MCVVHCVSLSTIYYFIGISIYRLGKAWLNPKIEVSGGKWTGIHWKMAVTAAVTAVTKSICTDYLLAYTPYEQYTRSQIPIENHFEMASYSGSFMCIFLFLFLGSPPILYSIALGYRHHHRHRSCYCCWFVRSFIHLCSCTQLNNGNNLW